MPDFQAQMRGPAILYLTDLTWDDLPNHAPSRAEAAYVLIHVRSCLRRTWLDHFMPGWSGRPEAKAPF